MLGMLKWGLWQKRWFIMWWSIAIGALILVNLVFYPSFSDQSAQLEQAFSQIPDSAKSFLSDTGDFASPTGYLSSQVFYLMLPMLLGILSIILGSSLLAKEEKEGTIELLLSRPVSRTRFLLSKGLVGLIIVLFVGLVGLVVTVGMASAVDMQIPSQNVAVASLAATLLALSFGAIAFMITSLGKVRIASVGIATLVALGGYILASLVDLANWLRWPSKAFPFYYYRPGEILNGTYGWKNIVYIFGLTVVVGIISWAAFRHRDIGN